MGKGQGLEGLQLHFLQGFYSMRPRTWLCSKPLPFCPPQNTRTSVESYKVLCSTDLPGTACSFGNLLHCLC